MASTDLKKLNRADLLKIVVKQQELIESQEKEIQQLKQKLDERILVCSQTGNIAQAALALNEVFEKAQAAADQYLESIKTINPEQVNTDE